MEFSTQINKFQSLGTYDYKFDEVGNVIANSSSAEFAYNYLSLMLLDSVYDVAAIESYYDVQFSEFLPAQTESEETESLAAEVQQNNEQLAAENEQLKEQIDSLIAASEEDSSVAKDAAIKQVILDLRRSLDKGKEEKDFSDVFPYTLKDANK